MIKKLCLFSVKLGFILMVLAAATLATGIVVAIWTSPEESAIYVKLALSFFVPGAFFAILGLSSQITY